MSRRSEDQDKGNTTFDIEVEEDCAVQLQQQGVEMGALKYHSQEDEGHNVEEDVAEPPNIEVEGDSTLWQQRQQQQQPVEEEEDEGEIVEEGEVKEDCAVRRQEQGVEMGALTYHSHEDEGHNVEEDVAEPPNIEVEGDSTVWQQRQQPVKEEEDEGEIVEEGEVKEDSAVRRQEQEVEMGALTYHSHEDEGHNVEEDVAEPPNIEVEGDSTVWQQQQQQQQQPVEEEDEGEIVEEDEVEEDGAAVRRGQQQQQDTERGELRHGSEKDESDNILEDEAESMETVFYREGVPPWREPLTFRALAVSFVISVLFSTILIKLSLTTAVIPSLNVAAGLLGFFFVKTWTKVMKKTGLLRTPFTRQENTLIQTCVVAASGIAVSGGFASNIFGMSSRIASQTGETNYLKDKKEPRLGWIIGFLFVVSFVGLFCLMTIRKIMIIDYELTYPSGTATAHLINDFHTPQGAKLAKKQVKKLGHFFVYSFLWSFFRWFYTSGNNCGFSSFPILGLKAFQQSFYFDFSPTYIGVGMICPYIVTASILFGGILSWGIMWPFIHNQKGNWYSEDFPESSIRSLTGYKVFIGIALILGDGFYNLGKLIHRIVSFFVADSHRGSTTIPVTVDIQPAATHVTSFENECRTKIFLKDQIPMSVALGGYAAVATISIVIVPLIFPQLKWYYILVAYVFAPILAYCNAYGSGLTDWSLASTYDKLIIFAFGAWVGPSNEGVLAGLVACGVMINIVSIASDLMQDFKTGFFTLTSPRSMFISQVLGTTMGCVISPCIFWLFYNAFKDMGLEGSEYPTSGAIYRNMAILGAEGIHSLPRYCLTLCGIFFVLAIIINLIRDLVPKKISQFIPIPTAMAIPFSIGSYFAIDTFLGSCILFLWKKINKSDAEKFSSAVASGMICGDGIWALPQSLLALTKVSPPICMKFLSRSANVKVDNILATLG